MGGALRTGVTSHCHVRPSTERQTSLGLAASSAMVDCLPAAESAGWALGEQTLERGTTRRAEQSHLRESNRMLKHRRNDAVQPGGSGLHHSAGRPEQMKETTRRPPPVVAAGDSAEHCQRCASVGIQLQPLQLQPPDVRHTSPQKAALQGVVLVARSHYWTTPQ